MEKVHAKVREHVTFMARDRFLSRDMKICAKLIRDGTIWNLVKDHIEAYED